jgi:HPt (histidine-containing phosphotransfer) domain-containing protein
MPVIALTANVISGVSEKLLAGGFTQYLAKPVVLRELEEALIGVLPEERVTIGCIAPLEGQVPVEIRDALARELSSFGVVLADGLKYVGGDIMQYGKSANIFIDCYSEGNRNVRVFAQSGDWAGLRFRVHSLKGNAKNIGANALSETAAKIERLCESGDGAYIAAALPALYLEWDRAKEGLTAFTGKLKAVLPKPENEVLPAPELSELLQMLQANRYPSSMDALAALIEAASPEMRESLSQIRKKTDELQFREAEQLLRTLMESEADENGN